MSLKDRRTQLIVAGLLATALVAAILILALGGEDDAESLEAALAYVPDDAPVVASLETDLSDEQWDSFAEGLGRGLVAELGVGGLGSEEGVTPQFPEVAGLGGFEGLVSAALLAQGINYEGQVEPVLGGQLVVAETDVPDELGAGLWGGDAVYALQAGSAGQAERLLTGVAEMEPAGEYRGARLFGNSFEGERDSEPIDSADVAIDGEVVVAADGEGGLKAAIDRARDDAGMSLEDFDAAVEGTPDDALIRAAANPARYLEVPELRPLAQLPWPAALRSAGAAVSFDGPRTELRVIARTDEVATEDIPFPTGEGEPELVRREREVASGSIDQSYTTAFLLSAARALYADSEFVRDIKRIERDLAIDFEQEVLRQFAGPSSSSVRLDGEFAARSTVADPEAMRALLPRLAPRLPELVRDLDSLGTEGLLALLFIAPDAPVSTVPTSAESVAPVAGEGEELLFEIRGPRGPEGLDPIVALPERIVFGMIGETFVVASDRARARAIAAADPEPVEGLEGASALVAEDLGPVAERLGVFAGVDLRGIESVRGTLEADIDQVEIRATASASD